MRAFFLKVISFFRTIIGTLWNNKKSLNVRLEVDSNHDGKPDITVSVNDNGVTDQPEINKSEE